MLAAGADALKLFPAEAGSPAMLRALRAVLPTGTLVFPVGGNRCVEHTRLAGGRCSRFGIGSAIYKPGDSPATVAAKADALMAAARG